jgi:hypothetical protein
MLHVTSCIPDLVGTSMGFQDRSALPSKEHFGRGGGAGEMVTSRVIDADSHDRKHEIGFAAQTVLASSMRFPCPAGAPLARGRATLSVFLS